MAEKSKSGIGLLAGSRREVLLLVFAAIFLAATLGTFVYTQRTAANDREYINLARSTQQQATDLGKLGADAASGITPDFRLLGGAQENMLENLDFMRNGDELFDLPPAPEAVQEELDILDETWEEMNEGIETILNGRSSYLTAEQYVFQLRDSMLDLGESMSAVGERLSATNASSDVVYQAASQLVVLERIRNGASRILGSGRNADLVVEGVIEDAASFKAALSALKDSSAYRDSTVKMNIDNMMRGMRSVDDALDGLAQLAPEIAEIQEASSLLSQLGTEVLASAIDLEDAFTAYSAQRPVKEFYAYIFGGLTGLFLLLFVALFLINVRRRQIAAERSEQMQQEAILTLLDEITNLADGDLTTTVTVTEDFTGAIADSINFTIETLRTLVGTINSTAGQVAEAAGSTLDTATNLNQASRDQTSQITSAAETAETMAERMQRMSTDAEKLAEQAQTSLETARSGGETVRRTIQGMDALREQIQDTSKRIKRLGESSQEIGNIIEFINDISEQTNTLALNASIQAAMAGESGKGFAVVADEVQRLAERAGTATKQIEALVKTIQADTNEAIISMERSTTNVVSGAQSAEEAGGALERIESFASDLARLIQEISGSAREQAGEASGVAETMQKVREIASQTASAADLTATSTRDLTTLSEQLRESVAGFRLPGEGDLEAEADAEAPAEAA